MSISIPSLPVLRGRDGAVLCVEDIGLVLDLPREQVTFTPMGWAGYGPRAARS
ncbi:hypothetical protein ACPCSP_12205 [Streptomyces cinereoruber]|uniref:hypothetical protein n=1 Tax=Streptomyces cinereoruber TaxID=67260 RepID=UPI003C2EF197